MTSTTFFRFFADGRTPPVWRFMLLFTAVLICASCASMGRARTPAWVTSPPPDTPAEFWGVGEGVDPDAATRAALRQIAARLRVSISAVTDSSVSVNQNQVNRSDQIRLQEVVRETEFTGVTVRESVRAGDSVYALVRVDRHAFVGETMRRYRELTQRVDQRVAAAAPSDGLAHYRALQASLGDAQSAVSLAQLLRVADVSGTPLPMLDALNSLPVRARQVASQLPVRLEFAPQDADVAALVGQWLTQAGFAVTSSQAAHDVQSPAVAKASVGALLRVRVDTRSEFLFDSWNCRLNVGLKWLGPDQTEVASRSHEVTGSSLESALRARNNAVRRLAQGVQGTDAALLLGLAMQ